MAPRGQWLQFGQGISKFESGALPGDGAEGQGGRGDARLGADGFALVGFLLVRGPVR